MKTAPLVACVCAPTATPLAARQGPCPAGLVDMALDGLGPGGGNDHTVDEWIDLPTLLEQTERAAVLINRLTGRGVS